MGPQRFKPAGGACLGAGVGGARWVARVVVGMLVSTPAQSSWQLGCLVPGTGGHQFKVGELPFLCPFSVWLLCRLLPLVPNAFSADWMGLEGLGGSFKPSFKIYLCIYGSRLVGTLVLRLEIESMHSAVKAPNLNHWTAKKFPLLGRILYLFLGQESMGLGGGTCLTCSWLFIFGMSMKTKEAHPENTEGTDD